ncbi:MAG: hypothetical protein LW878_07460 [Proteobacteria bacterium]|jgi:hypothetical protein|nr:hypothetical protein [Pseudomonadota bacterium]
MNNLLLSGPSPRTPGDEGSIKKNTPPYEVPEREEGEEYISIKDDPKKIDVPRS